jgi:class 3 adenylate cyclase
MMAVDLVASTEILQEIGEERVYDLLQHVLAVAKQSVITNGGVVIDTAGDGLLAAFGAPRALENASFQACKAASMFQSEIEKDATALAQRFGVRPEFRIGIAGGNVMVVQVSSDEVKVVGDPVNLAARLQAKAAPREILLSEDIWRETEGFLQTIDRGLVDIKGFAETVQVHSLVAIAPVRSRFEGTQRGGFSALVSREAELEQVVSDLDARCGPNIVGIVGLAGIGKSRLLFEVIATLPDGRPVYVGQCAPTGQAGFAPIYDMIRQASPASPDADFGAVLIDLHAAFPTVCDADLITSVAGPADEKVDTLTRALQERDALLAILRGLYRVQAAVFVIEDVHWIDTATHDLIDLLKDDPVPLIVTCRPTTIPAWLADLKQTKLELQRLSSADIRTIVEARFTQTVSPQLADVIAIKSEGIPLIAEEIARALEQANALVMGSDGLDVKDGDHTFLTGNLQQLVLSRVDRLPSAQKELLQIASAIGRGFAADVLMAAAGTKNVDLILSAMAGLVEPQIKGHWRFSHALIRDAVYAGLLSGQRTGIHYQVAVAIETLRPNAPESASQLAYHFTNANVPAKAVAYLIASAELQLGVYAVVDADQSLERAMQMIEADPSVITDDQLGLMAATWLQALDAAAKHARSEEIASRILPRLEGVGYTPNLGKARTLAAMALTHRTDYRTAKDLSLQTLHEAETAGDALGAAWAKVTLMRVYDETFWEPIETIERLAKEIAPVAEATGDRYLGMTALYLLSAAYRSFGSRIRALEVADEIANVAKTHNDRRAQAYAQWSRAIIYSVEGNPEASYDIVKSTVREAIPGTADHLVSTCIEIFGLCFFRPVAEVRAKLAEIRAHVGVLGDHNLIHSMDWVAAMLAFKNGNLVLGWKLINALIDELNRRGNINILRQAYILRSEIVLSIAGLIDLGAEAPPDRPVFAKDRPGLADVLLFARLKLTAKRKATADLNRYIAIHPVRVGTHYARAQIGLGLIAMSNKDHAKARKLLIIGRDIAVIEGMPLLLKRADHALNAMPTQ